MSDTELTTAPAAAEPPARKPKAKPETAKPAPPVLPAYRPRPTGAPVPIAALAATTQTSATVLAGLKAAFRWTDSAKMTRAEFLAKRDAWLSRPASEV